MTTCNCGHKIIQRLSDNVWLHNWAKGGVFKESWKVKKCFCSCINPEPKLEPSKFKVGDVIQLKDDIAQIGQIEEIKGNKYVYDFEGKSYIELIDIIDKCFELKEVILNAN